MNRHRWAFPKFQRSCIKHERWHAPHRYEKAKIEYCVQCGAAKFTLMGSPWAGPWQQFYRKREGLFKMLQGGMPPCEGLPANYEMPIGA